MSFPENKTWRLPLLFGALLIALFAVNIPAQDITSGSIQGTVVDEQGAVVPGALVEARNTATNSTRSFTTDASGRFTFLSLQPGRYTVSITKQGFAKLNQENVDVTVGRTVTLGISLRVSGVSGEVTITTTPTIDSSKTEASTTLNETAISNTPILGRKFEDLLTLTPGVSITQGPDGDEINFAGQRGIFNNVSLDGGDYNNGFFGEQAGGQRAAIDISLDAIKEFQVIATGANAEYGRTAGGIINVITKSGTNTVHGSVFYNFRNEKLSSKTSDGKPLTDFKRQQFGGTIGGPIAKDTMFYFFAFEGIHENLTRFNLGEQVGPTACPTATPTILANEALINSNADCQRRALVNFIQSSRGTNEAAPVDRSIRNYAFLGKFDFDVTANHKLGMSYNFDHSKNLNQTFDVPTYGASANGTEGASRINVFNLNLYSTISPTMLNDFHFTFSDENRPRSANISNVPADTAMGFGFGPTFRVGQPFFLQPGIDEVFWRTQFRDHLSIVKGTHTYKIGGEWMHSLNDQVFRGFFKGRYLFDSTSGFLRYASTPAVNGFGPNAGECFVAPTTPGGPLGAFTGWITQGLQTCPAGSVVSGPLLLYLQNGISTGLPGVPEPGASKVKNEDFALFVQDKWQVSPKFTLSYGLRWEAQIFPDPVVPPSQTAYGPLLNDPRFPSDGTLHSQKAQFQPRVGIAWDFAGNGKSLLRASYGMYYARQNMLTQVGSITDNGVQQYGIACASSFGCSNGAARPAWPNVVAVAPGGGIQPGSSVRVFDKNYKNPRINTFNAQFEQQLFTDVAAYVDFTYSRADHLTRFLNYGGGRTNFFPTLGDVFVTSSIGKSRYYGITAGLRKRFSNRFQMEANYVWSKDKDDDSNERDPFNDRSFNVLNPGLDYSLSDRDIRHKFNFFAHFELPGKIEFTPRLQARTAQPATPAVRTATNRNTLRKDNEYLSFDWRLSRPISLSERVELIPQIEMFNTFNNDNFVNSLWTPGNQSSLVAPSLFNFDGFLRQGIGDPRQVQLSIRLKF